MPGTSISPQQWLAAFIIAAALHVLAGGLFLAIHNIPEPATHSPRGVMVSLDALSVGNSLQPASTPEPVTPAMIPSAKPVPAATPQATDDITTAEPAPAAAAPATPVAPEPVQPTPADTVNAASNDANVDIPVAKTVTIQTADTLEAMENTPVVKARPPSQAAVPTVQGSGAHGLSDNPTVTYIASLRGWLGEHKYYPMAARRSGAQGTVRLYLVVGRDGHVLNVSIARSSGNSILDQAAMDMVKRSEPLPSMPDNLLRTRIEIILPVRFTLAGSTGATTTK